MTPFTVEQFLEVFAAYNRAVYPSQFFLVAAALIAIFLAIGTGKNSSRLVSAILVVLWLWSGIVYHLLFFTRINNLAYIFGALFVLQAAIIFYSGVVKDALRFRFRCDKNGFVGIIILLYAVVLYPLFGYFAGHFYPQMPTFGLPCPLTIFTFGLLFWTDKKVPSYVLPIPLLWSLIGFAAAFSFGILEDIGLPIAGIIGSAVLIRPKPKRYATA